MGLSSCVSLLSWAWSWSACYPVSANVALYLLFSLGVVSWAMTSPRPVLWHGWNQKFFVCFLNQKWMLNFIRGLLGIFWANHVSFVLLFNAFLNVHSQNLNFENIFTWKASSGKYISLAWFSMQSATLACPHLQDSRPAQAWLSLAEPENAARLVLVFPHHRLSLWLLWYLTFAAYGVLASHQGKN